MSEAEKLAPGELWQMLTTTPRPFKVIDFPRMDPAGKPVGKVAIHILTQGEQMTAAASAERFVKRILKDNPPKAGEENFGYDVMYNNESSVQVLVLACRDAKDLSRQAFPTADEMRRVLTVTEIGALMEAYMQFQTAFGPLIYTMTEIEMEAWLTRIAEDAERTLPLYLLSRETKSDLLRYSALTLRDLRMATSSVGSPPVVPQTSDAS